jgi:hypothetical protein
MAFLLTVAKTVAKFFTNLSKFASLDPLKGDFWRLV